ncbi:AfsR/SARP family transcriptional regulator [Nocardia sp. NPDC052566]|uniref:AfsR/SARP family transcriptional regulator n=1 Tax=Nocardia sp. NPDC052566 TaxID=3364330 RepID=UPI0037C5F2E0
MDVLGLGPVQVWADGVAVAIDRPLERAVLVRLALADGVPVPDGRLAEDLWGAEVERPVQRLRVVVSRLRAALKPHAELIERTPAGYQSAAVVADLRAAEAAAQRMYAARRTGEHAAVAAAAREALALWRGPAFADLRGLPFAAAEGDRLDDWRLSLTVAGLEANLELGAAGEVVTELTGLVSRHPLHEPLGCLLALALYRTGRQADALDRLARLRRVLVEQLGVDPSPDTTALELRILDHDPTLRSPYDALRFHPEASGSAHDSARRSPNDVRSPRNPSQGGSVFPRDAAAKSRDSGAGASSDAAGRAVFDPAARSTHEPPHGVPRDVAGRSSLDSASGSPYYSAEGAVRDAECVVFAPQTSFLGRGREFAALASRLTVPGLTTVTGVAGSGKSRLAAELARATAYSGRRVVFVELAPLGRTDDIPGAVVAALENGALLDGNSADPADPLTTIATALGVPQDDTVLLVLDNAEHVVDAVAEVVGVARGAGVLVTSQRALGVAGESVYPLGALDRSVGVALFTERAGLNGLVTAGEREELVRICAAVDWLPLGIELAAGLTRVLTISQLAQRIDDRVRLLVGGPRDAGGGRHTSLRMALDWSYELLDEREQVVLRRLGVFAGGASLEAAEAVVPGPVGSAESTSGTDILGGAPVAGGHDDVSDHRAIGGRARGGAVRAAIEVGDVAPAVADLVNRNLVTVQSDGAAKRFVLLETVRDYALSRSAEADETERMRAAHLNWCLDRVRALGEPDDFAGADAVAAVFAEWPNTLAALDNAPGTSRAADGLALATAMHVPWLARAWYREASRHFAALVDTPGLDPHESATALSHSGFHSLMTGELDRAAHYLARAATVAAPVDDLELAQTVRYYQGIVDIERCVLPAAVARLREGERLAQSPSQGASFADALGTALLDSGDPDGALAAYRRSAEVDKDNGDEHGLSRGLSNEARALLDLGRIEEALAAAEASDRYARRLDDRQILPLNDLVRAGAALAAGQLDAAESYCRAAFAHEGDADGMARVDLADVLIAKGELAEARELLADFADAPHGIPWQAANAVTVTLLLAGGEEAAARDLAKRLHRQHTESGFGWRRYADRVRALVDS